MSSYQLRWWDGKRAMVEIGFVCPMEWQKAKGGWQARLRRRKRPRSPLQTKNHAFKKTSRYPALKNWKVHCFSPKSFPMVPKILQSTSHHFAKVHTTHSAFYAGMHFFLVLKADLSWLLRIWMDTKNRNLLVPQFHTVSMNQRKVAVHQYKAMIPVPEIVV